MFPVNDSFLASKGLEDEIKDPLEGIKKTPPPPTTTKKNTPKTQPKQKNPRGEHKEKENNLDFLYLALCYVCPLHWAVNFNWTATYCMWVHTGSIK